MNDFDKLGFDVGVSEQSYKDTVSRLDEIIKKLEKIQQLDGKGSTNKVGATNQDKNKLSEIAKYQERITRQTELLKAENYEAYRATELLNQATQKQISNSILLNSQQVRQANVEARLSQLKAENAIQTDLLANAEWSVALANQTSLEYQKKQITQMARLKAEQEALNNGKYEEARTIEIANQARKKEIDQRIKQELGIKDNTKSLTSYLSKLTSVVVVARKLARFMSGAIQESASYIENLNLFAVAYGETDEQTLDWALNLADSFGLANNEVVKFAGTFRELSTSLGIVGDTADLVSKTVTNLGYDLSALFNTTVEQAMEKLESIWTGNVRPLRAYGIDISQNQINALFETNEALKQLGANAQNLSQSDKVLARLIITLQSGKDSFGTMAREINNLQSQFRIFQGSLANFKLAIGDLIEEPLSRVMVLLNAVVIAMTNVIRSFVPLQTKDETPKAIINTALGAEEANEALDELNSKLASFDKFNVLQQGGGESSSLAVTEALNKLLQEQASLYDDELSEAMKQMKNESVKLAEKLEDLVVIGGAFIAIFTVSKVITSIKNIKDGFSALTGATGALNKGLSLTNTLLIVGIVYSVYKFVKAIKEGDTVTAIIAGTIGGLLITALILFTIQSKKAKMGIDALTQSVATNTSVLNSNISSLNKTSIVLSNISVALASASLGFMLFDSILNELEPTSKKTVSIIMIVVGALATLLGVILAIKGAVKGGIAGAIVGGLGVGAIIAGIKGIVNTNVQGFADGGYSNANLIMIHENGKREAIMAQGKSNVIMNNTQMTDIMEHSVSKGTYNALRAYGAVSGNSPTNETIVVKIGEEAVFNAVVKTAKKQGKGFSNI